MADDEEENPPTGPEPATTRDPGEAPDHDTPA